MANKRPLVVTAGMTQQLQSADLIDPACLATGTANSSVFLRGDGTWNYALVRSSAASLPGLIVSVASATTNFATDFAGIDFRNTDSTVNNYSGIAWSNTSANYAALHYAVYTTHGSSPRADLVWYTRDASSMAERMRLASTGALGLGINPVNHNAGYRLLHLDGGATGAEIRLTNTGTGTAASNGSLITIAGGSDLYIYNFESAIISFGTSGTERLNIGSGGIVTHSLTGIALHTSSFRIPNTVQIAWANLAGTYTPTLQKFSDNATYLDNYDGPIILRAGTGGAIDGNLHLSSDGLFSISDGSAYRIYADNTGMWAIRPTSSQLYVGDAIDYDRQIAIGYTPGTTGAIGGSLAIGQTNKNHANYTHGSTNFYTNGVARLGLVSSTVLLLGDYSGGLQWSGYTGGGSCVLQLGNGNNAIEAQGSELYLFSNVNFSSGARRFRTTSTAMLVSLTNGGLIIYGYASQTAGTALGVPSYAASFGTDGSSAYSNGSIAFGSAGTGTISSNKHTATSTSSSGIATTTGSLGAFECYNASGGGAFLTFHRAGSYGVYLGVDTDNVLRYGGWSAGANAYMVHHDANTGTLTGWTPVLTATSGTITSQACAGYYSRLGPKLYFIDFYASITNIGSATGYAFVDLPFNLDTNWQQVIQGRETQSTGAHIHASGANGGAARMIITRYDNNAIIGTNYTYAMQGIIVTT